MKRIIVLSFVIILLVGNRNIIFASYNNMDEISEAEIKVSLQEIFNKRIEVWNAFMIGENLSLVNIKEDLKIYIAEPLLTIDLNIYEDMMNNPTSYEVINDVKILNCQLISRNEKNRSYLVSIAWELEDLGEIIHEELEYKVEVVKIKDNWLLKNYELNQ